MIYYEAKCINANRGIHAYLIDETWITLSLRPKDFNLVYSALLHLKNLDIQAFASVINTEFKRNINNKILNVKPLFQMADTLFQNQFKSCIWKICDLFKEKSLRINFSRVAKYLFTADLSKINSKVSIEVISKVTNIEGIIKEYETNLFSILMKAMDQFDYKSVWAIFPIFEVKPWIEKIRSSVEWLKTVEEYVINFGEKVRIEGKELKYKNFIGYVMYGDYEGSKIANFYPIFNSLPIFKKVAINTYNEIVKLSAADQSWDMNKDTWYVYKKNITNHYKRIIEFTGLPDEIKKDLKIYARELIQLNTPDNKLHEVAERIKRIKTILIHLCDLYPPLNSFADITYYHVLHLITHLQTIKNQKNKTYSLLTIKGFTSEMRVFTDWFYKVNKIDQINPFRKYQFRNVKSFSEGIEYIPEEIVEQLQKHLHEVPEWIQNAWTIMMNSGSRISDVLELKESCLNFDESHQTYILSYIPVKIKNYRASKGMDPYHRIPANDAIRDAVYSQIELTKELRYLSGSKNIFLNSNDYSIYVPHASYANATINIIIEKYQIKDSEGNLFHYSNHMCRKTVVMDLLEKGASFEDIANYVAHMTPKTTRDYYAELKLKKIAELYKLN